MHIIDTHRLTLRPWNENDLFDFHEFISDERVSQCSGSRAITDIEISKECIHNYIIHNLSYAVVLKASNKVIGSIGMDRISPDENLTNLNQRYIGYTIHPNYWGNGYATEAAQCLIKYLFEECDLDLVWTSHYDFNIRSSKVIAKCGFKYAFSRSKTLKSLDNKAVNELFYKISKNEFNK